MEIVQNDGLVLEVYWKEQKRNFVALIAPDWSKKNPKFYVTPDFGQLTKSSATMKAAIVLMRCAATQDALNGLINEHGGMTEVKNHIDGLIAALNVRWKAEDQSE